MNEIGSLWFLMHQPEGQGGVMECIIAGPPDASYQAHAIGIADLIRHLALAKGCEDADIWAAVQDELDNPTSNITRTGPN